MVLQVGECALARAAVLLMGHQHGGHGGGHAQDGRHVRCRRAAASGRRFNYPLRKVCMYASLGHGHIHMEHARSISPSVMDGRQWITLKEVEFMLM